MSAPTVFLSAATIDLLEWRDLLASAFRAAHFRVLVQGDSLGVATGSLRDKLVECIEASQCVIHLAGTGYGADASDAFPEDPGFQCSWMQFEYYYAHSRGIPVVGLVCAPDLGAKFTEKGTDDADVQRKQRLQEEHRNRLKAGTFNSTPLAGKTPRTLNHPVDSLRGMFECVASCVHQIHNLGAAIPSVAQVLETRARLHQLPPDPRQNGFVGRHEDLDKMLAQATSAVTAITGLKGMGGIGKTALSVVLAHELASRFPGGQLFVECRGTALSPSTAQELLIRVIDLLHPGSARGLPEELASLCAIYQNLLHGQRLLLVLDNAAGTEQVKHLLPPAGCGLIVSSRQPLQLGKAALVHTVGRLKEVDAIALLREFHPGLLDAEAKEIVRLCGALPLALKLAGSHLQLDGPEPDVASYIAALQRSRIGALDPEAADAGEVTISETLRLSEDMLAPEERAAWRALGVFTHSFQPEAAASVIQAWELGADDGSKGARTLLSATSVSSPVQANDSREDEVGSRSMADRSVRAPVDAAAHLSTFTRRSLLERLPDGRYQMHDLAAEYAREKLGEETCTTLRLAHARHYQEVAYRSTDLYLEGKPVEGLALFDAERGGIEAAFEWLRAKVVASFSSSDKAEASSPTNTQALGAGEAVPAKAEDYFARLLIGLVNAVVYTGQELRFHPRQQRIPWLEAQLAAAQRLGDRRAEGTALGNLGLAHAALGDARKAIEFYEQALAIAREIGDRRGEGNALWNSALALDSLGERAAAIPRAQAALAIREAIEDPTAARVRATLTEWGVG